MPQKPRVRNAVAVAAVLTLAGCSSKTPTPQADLDRKFQQSMSGVTLVGRSSRLNGDQISGQEKYAIEKVTKLAGETWLLQTHMQFGSHDLPVPVPVVIKWAGDTPVITVTDLKLPGLNPYTARVVLYGDQYAGTWSGTALAAKFTAANSSVKSCAAASDRRCTRKANKVARLSAQVC